jgi:hypothetical protein
MNRTSTLAWIVIGASMTSALGCTPVGARPAAKPGQTAGPAALAATEVALPASPAGEAAAAWLRAVNDGSREETLSFLRTRYAKPLLDEWSAEDRRSPRSSGRSSRRSTSAS